MQESLSLSLTLVPFNFLALNMVKSFVTFGHSKYLSQAWWLSIVKEAVSQRQKAFDFADKGEECPVYVLSFQHGLSVMAKTKVYQKINSL